MRYYLDGRNVTESFALETLALCADRTGHCPDDWQQAWKHREYSEAARDYLCEVSGYSLEIEVE